MMLYVMGFGWLFTSFLFFSGPGLSDIANLTSDGWVSVTFLGIACSGLAYIFWYSALQRLPAAQVGAFLYIEPLVTMLLAAVLINEPLLWASILGGAIILLGVWLVNRRVRKPVVRKGILSKKDSRRTIIERFTLDFPEIDSRINMHV
jgi:drug/metabolite transporter (DMT)-like permease